MEMPNPEVQRQGTPQLPSTDPTSSPTWLPSIIVGLVIAFLAALSIWYLARPPPLLVQGKADATRFDIAARVDGRVAQIPVVRGQDVAAGASCLIRRAWFPVSLAAIWCHLPGFTGDGGTCGSNRADEGKLREGNCDTRRKDHDDTRSNQIEKLIGRHPLRPTVRP